jgi:hypothetical protein
MALKESEIEVGGVYIGPGRFQGREVDALFDVGGVRYVHWFWYQPVELSDGRYYWTPNGTCTLKRFAQWAKIGKVGDSVCP